MTRRAVVATGVSLYLFCSLAADPAARQETQASFAQGQSNADETLKELNLPRAGAFAEPPAGYLIAEGDSWFDYPGLDVLSALSGGKLDSGARYKIYSAASAGDTVESMAYDRHQREGFAAEFVKVLDAGKKQEVKGILISGGGNDIAGREFHILLNHSNSATATISALDLPLADAFIDRIGRNLESLIGTTAQFSDKILGRKDIPILIHGYGPAVPDGRPFLFGWPLPGPWLQPGFTAKGYVHEDGLNDLEKNTKVMATLIERFNVRLSKVPANLAGVADVRYVDVRAVLKNTVAGDVYKKDWANELHPRDVGFIRVAEAFHQKLQKR